MSTEEGNLGLPPLPEGVIASNTVANTMRMEHKDRRLEPIDLRTIRYGYNPGFLMTMDPVYTGLQTELIQPGVLLPFETFPVSRQNLSVDKDDRTPPDKMGELLAGEALGNIYFQNATMGFRELLPLRGRTQDQAGRMFYKVHPPLREIVASEVIPPCVFNLANCVTCRFNFLSKIDAGEADSLLSIVKESNAVGRSFMANWWRTWTGEVASVKAQTNRQMALANLNDNHLYFMYQLHERSPEEKRMEEAAASAKANALLMEQAMSRQAEVLADALRNNTDGTRAAQSAAQINEQAELRERLRLLELQIANMQKPLPSEENPEG